MINAYCPVMNSAVRAATSSSAPHTNCSMRGLHLIIDVTDVPGTDTITPKLEGFDTLSGKYYDLLVGVAMAATGTQILKLYPGITAAANASASDILPRDWRVTVTHSAGTNFTYSVSAHLSE